MSGLAFAALVLCLHITAGESQQFTTIVEHSEINVAVGGTSPASSPQTSATVNLRVTGESQQFTTIVEHSEIDVAVGGTSPASSPQTSATVILRVTDPVAVTGVTVVTNDSAPLENLDTIALSCDASGAVQTRTWFKDDQPIQENGRIFTSPDRAKLTIIGVNRNDAGTYKCIASNSISSGTGETYVQVYYGTEKVRIVPERPVVSNIVSNLTLTCFALSVPWGIYAWYNGNNLLQTGQELTLVSMSSVNVGSYTCRVTNDVTKRSSNLTVHVTAQASKPDERCTLTSGAIVGIVLGLIGVGLIGGVSGWLIARKTGGIKDPPQSKLDTSINSGRTSPLDTETVNASQNYENFPRNEQGSKNNTQDGNSTYTGLVLGDRSVYSDLKR